VKKIKVDGDDVVEICDDVKVETVSIIDTSIAMHLMYDNLFDDFYVSLKKEAQKEEEERRVLLNPNNVEKLHEAMDKIASLSRRYQTAGREVTFEFDLGTNIAAHLDFNLYTTIDIRKHFQKGTRSIWFYYLFVFINCISCMQIKKNHTVVYSTGHC